MNIFEWMAEEGQEVLGMEEDRCPVCCQSSWDGSDVYLAEDGLWVHDRCVGRSLIYSMDKLRVQWRNFMGLVAKETGLLSLVKWLNKKLS